MPYAYPLYKLSQVTCLAFRFQKGGNLLQGGTKLFYHVCMKWWPTQMDQVQETKQTTGTRSILNPYALGKASASMVWSIHGTGRPRSGVFAILKLSW